MPLSKVERQVLELICDEHHQTRRGAKTSIVHVGMNAVTSQQKARIVDVLIALKKRGLLVFGYEAWLPSIVGERALRGASVSNQGVDAKPVCSQCTRVLCEMEAEHYGNICNDCFKDMEEAPIAVDTTSQPAPPTPLPIDACPASVERIGAPMPDELLNRCAVMNAALLAQATRRYEEGVPGAWRDMNWLVETGKQLLALGGEA